MKALTLWQPWSWAIANAGKRIENRTWPPPRWIVGHRIAIHAGKKIDDSSIYAVMQRHDIPPKQNLIMGAVESVAVVRGWIDRAPRNSRQAEWWIGPCGWVLSDVVAMIAPIPCRGAQRLWDLPAEIETEVIAQLRAVRKSSGGYNASL